MIATICIVTYLVGAIFSIFILIPWLIARGTIADYESDDAILKGIIWPVWLLALFIIALFVLIFMAIYIPCETLFNFSVEYFKSKRTQE